MNKPTIASKQVEASLLNGLNGLGFGTSANFGIVGKYPLNKKIYLGSTIEYSGWSSTNSCDCNDSIATSENSLSFFQISAFLQYYLINKLYAYPEISFNFLGVKVNEESRRGTIGFSKTYPRIGIGLGVGYELALSEDVAFDLSVKAQLPNFLLTKDKDNSIVESTSLINSKLFKEEAQILILSFNIGILFSL